VRKAGSREEEEASLLMVVMQEAFAGIRVVKTHAREDFESKRFNLANWEIMGHMIRWRKAIELNGPAVETIASLGVGLGAGAACRIRRSRDGCRGRCRCGCRNGGRTVRGQLDEREGEPACAEEGGGHSRQERYAPIGVGARRVRAARPH